MSKRGKHYRAELKQKVLQELQIKSVAEVSQSYGISAQTLYLWRRIDQTQQGSSQQDELSALRKENGELRRKNQELEQEREILQKAVGYFAKD